MKNCKASNIEELNNIIQNGGEIYVTSANQTQTVTSSFFKHSRDNFSKKEGLYTTIDGGAKLKTTVTTEISKKFEKRYAGYTFKNLEASAQLGTFIHTLNEEVFNYFNSLTQSLSTKDTIDLIENLSWGNVSNDVINTLLPIYKASDIKVLAGKSNLHNLQALFEGAKDVFLNIHKHQALLNKRLGTDGKAEIIMEQLLIDPKADMGGTADLIALYSDNTAAVYDFKTKIPAKKYVNEKGELISYDYISNAAKEKYTLQLASLQRILTKRYGVKQVITSRIVPIQLAVPLDSEGNLGKTITKIRYGSKQNIFLSEIAPLPESTGYKDLDDYLNNIEAKIKEYRKKNTEYHKNKIEELEHIKHIILVRKSFKDLSDYSKKLFESIGDLSNLSLERLRDLKDELKSLMLLNRATHEYKEVLEDPAEKDILDEAVRSITTTALDILYNVEKELYNKRLSTYINDSTGYSILDQSGRFITFNDEGFAGKYFNQLSHYDNPVFKSLKASLDKAQYKIREKVKKLLDNVIETDNNLRNWMKENGKDEAWLIKSLIDTDPKSPDLENLYSRLSKTFREEIKNLKSKADVNKIMKYYEPSKYYLDNFQRLKAEKKLHFEKTLPDEKAVKFALQRWSEKNDLSLDEFGDPIFPKAWANQLKYGKLKLKDNVAESNLSEEYKYIRSIPPLLAYYEMFEKYNKEFRNILGVEYYTLPNNFIPNIRKSNIDRLLDNGIIAGSQEIVNNFIQELEVREDDMLYGEIDPDTGELKKTIPKFYLNPFKNNDGSVRIGEKSYDLTKSLILFSKMAYNYEHMNEIESLVLTMRDFLSEKGEQVIKRGDTILKDYVGNELSSKIQGKQIESIFQSYVDLYLYGVNVNPISADSTGKYEKLILQAKQYFTLKALGLGFIPATGSFLAAKTQAAIEGFKGQAYTSEQYKNSMRFSYAEREKFLALYGFFDPINVKYDFFNVSKDGTAIGDPRERNKVKRYVNSRMLLRTFSAGDEYIDEVILASLAQNFYIDENYKLRRMVDDEDRKNKKSLWDTFSYSNGEAKLDIPEDKLEDIIIAFRGAAQATQSKIKGVIPEDDKAYWQTQIVGQILMHFKSWMPGVMRERFGKTRYNDALQLVEMGRFTAFGQELYNYEQLSIPMFAKEIVIPKLLELGKHLMWYKPGSGSDNRLELAYENWLNKNPQYKGVVSFKEFKSAQQAQMKALIIELRLILTFAMLIALLGADFDDDGKKFYQEMWVTRKLVAVLAKTNQEISFTYNPAEFANMIKNPIPMAGVLTDAVNVLANTYDETVDIALGEKFPLPFHKPQEDDKTNPLYYTGKLIPGVSQLEKFLEIFNKDNSLK